MPKVHPYLAETSATGIPQGRLATEGDFGADKGMVRLGAGLESAASVINEKQTQDDVTNVRVKMAQAQAKWTVAFRDESMKSQPGDPEFAAKFSQSVSDDMDKLRGIATTRGGQRTFDQMAAEMNGHFAEKAGNFQIQSAGVKARLDFDVAQRAYATSVITDPTSYGKVLDQAMAELHDPNGRYGRIDANARQGLETKVRDTLAQSYINGLIDNGAPELARKQLMDGRLDDQLDPKDKQRLVHAADAGITQKRVAGEHDEARARRDEKIRVDAINDGLMGQFAAGKLTMPDVRAAGLPAFGEGSQATWAGMLKQQAKDWADKPARTESAVYSDTLERIRLPYGDPRKLLDANDIYKLYGNGLSSTDTDRLAKKLRDDATDDGRKIGQTIENMVRGVKPQLDKSTFNSIDAGGADRVAAFRDFVEKHVEEARKANIDPRTELLNRDSPKWLGHQVTAFQTGAQRTAAKLSEQINTSMEPKTVAPKPRKSLDDIFKSVP